MKPDKTLEELDKDIAKWQVIVEAFPLNDAYKIALQCRQQERVDYVSKIGVK